MNITKYLHYAAIGTVLFVTLQKNIVSQTVQDIDGNTYNTVQISNQEWMTENLKTTKLNDGTTIPFISDNIAWSHLVTSGFSWYNNDSLTYKNRYGAYYNWFVINTGMLCPSGWHIPSDAEWKNLELYLGMTQQMADDSYWRGTDQGLQLKSTTDWSNNGNGNNNTGFNAKPGGYRFADGEFGTTDDYASWWTATEMDSDYALNREMNDADALIGRSESDKKNGYSVRCVKD